MDLSWIRTLAYNNVIYPFADFERCITALEFTCAEKLRLTASQNLTFDMNVVCDVCRSPNANSSNEMVFCDGCNLCVHQNCYGIRILPEGEWLCAPCASGLPRETVDCVLCPSKSGALKPVDNSKASYQGEKTWCHLSCALWIPETYVADLHLMQPILGVNKILNARWKLLCYICKEKEGACIQCAVRTCLKSFHVTCAINGNLYMQSANSSGETVFESNKDNQGRKQFVFSDNSESISPLLALCNVHSEERNSSLLHESRLDTSPRRNNQMRQRSAQRNTAQRKGSGFNTVSPSKSIREFYKLINVNELAQSLQMNARLVAVTAEYWKQKRILKNNKPLINNLPTLKVNDRDRSIALCEYLGFRTSDESSVWCTRIVTEVRQELERVRTLAYLIERREKIKRLRWKILQTHFKSKIKCSEVLPENNSRKRADKISLPSSSEITEERSIKRGRGRPRKYSTPNITIEKIKRKTKKPRRCRVSISPQNLERENLNTRDNELMESVVRDDNANKNSRLVAGLRCSQRALVKYSRLNIRRFIAYNPRSKGEEAESLAIRQVGRPRKSPDMADVKKYRRLSE